MKTVNRCMEDYQIKLNPDETEVLLVGDGLILEM